MPYKHGEFVQDAAARYCFDCESVLGRSDDALCLVCIEHRAMCAVPRVVDTANHRSVLCHGAGPAGTSHDRLSVEPFPILLPGRSVEQNMYALERLAAHV